MKKTKKVPPLQIIDYNGTGRWSLQSVQERYAAYAQQLNVTAPLDLVPPRHKSHGKGYEEVERIYPVMFEVIEGIEQGDKACIEIGLECIEENQWLSFGRIIKANTARALRRSSLHPLQVERLRKQIVSMLLGEHIPGHYREYAKLLRKIGLGNWWSSIEKQANCNNPHVLRYYNYFQQYARRE